MTDQAVTDRRALLITMPWMHPNMSCLALSTLKPILEQAGIHTDTLYGSVLFPLTDTLDTFLEGFGSFLFVPYLYPETDVDALIDCVSEQHYQRCSLHGLLDEKPRANDQGDGRSIRERMQGFTKEEMQRFIRADIERAGVCLDRCFAIASQPQYDVIGFSITFETQIPAALALARRLKRHNPAVKLAFGGAACMENQADGLVASFDVVDAACHTEGDQVIVPMFRALRGELPLADVPGIVFRDAEGRLQHNPSPPLLENLDSLPMPRYEDYLDQLSKSEWTHVGPRLFFETSRGCWWGQKHLCTFCGLNAEGLAYRSKSPERAFEEIEMLYRTYTQGHLLQATDNILDSKYFTTLLPRLARLDRDPKRPLMIFYEVKSNMKQQHVALLAAAGIQVIQPGIEAFDDQVLQLMDKGCTGLGQVQFLKWAYQEGIKPIYNLILRNPGEQVESYRRMIALLPFLTHLPPPSGVTPMILERFSPYFERSSDFGITAKRPKRYYRSLYPDPGVDLDRIAYQFEYDHPMYEDAELTAVLREFAWRLARWSVGWKPRKACYVERQDHLVIFDDRGPTKIAEPITGLAAELFRYVDATRTFQMIAARFPGIDPEFLRSLLERWHHRRWVFRSPNDMYLAVLPLVREKPVDVEQIVAAVMPQNPNQKASTAKRFRDLRVVV